MIIGRALTALVEQATVCCGMLTGSEDIFFDDAIFDMTEAEIRKKLDELVTFAKVERSETDNTFVDLIA